MDRKPIWSGSNTAAFVAPAAGTYGNASRNSIEMPGTVAVSGSISRTISFGETRGLEMRLNMSNMFNTVQNIGEHYHQRGNLRAGDLGGRDAVIHLFADVPVLEYWQLHIVGEMWNWEWRRKQYDE